MPNMNPMQLIAMIKNGRNPQQLVMSILENNMSSNPIGANMLNMIKSGNTGGIEQIARNMCASKGIDFDKEFMNFRSQFGL